MRISANTQPATGRRLKMQASWLTAYPIASMTSGCQKLLAFDRSVRVSGHEPGSPKRTFIRKQALQIGRFID
jgi:hypothetical protein